MYSSIVYIEPFDWRNRRAFGYDMWSNEMRRSAMRRARDEGVAATSGIVTLVQETDEDVQKGFLTYAPVYQSKAIPDTMQERRDQFVGWIYAAYRAGDLMHGILGTEDPNIEFEVFDGEHMSQDTLLFDSNYILHLEDRQHQPEFQQTIQVNNQGRTWTLYFNTSNAYLTGSEQIQPRFVALAGVMVHLLLFYVIWSLYFINRRAELIAKEMTLMLEKSKSELEVEVRQRTVSLKQARDELEAQVSERTKELNTKVQQLQRMNDAMVGREKRMIELKQENALLKKQLNSQYDVR